MPSNITDYGQGALLSFIFGLTTPPTGYYIALATQDPGQDIDGSILADVEPPPGSGYARVTYGAGPSAWSDPAQGGYVSNLDTIDYGIPISDWGIITHWVLCDSLTDGEVYGYGEFNQPVFINSTFQVSIPPGALTIALFNILPSIVNT